MKYSEYLIEWLRERVHEANAKGLIIGISGGIDSALVSVLAKRAFPNSTLGILMPCKSVQSSIDDGLEHVKRFGIAHKIIDLSDAFDTMAKLTNVSNKLALNNIKPRLRMTTLYALAQENNYLVLGTDNADEMYLGYFTKYGDGGVDLLPISQLTKSEVREMCKELDVSDTIINKAPSADLWEGQTDEQEIGVPYDEIDKYIKGFEIKKEYKERIEYLHKISNHKRNPIPVPKHPLQF